MIDFPPRPAIIGAAWRLDVAFNRGRFHFFALVVQLAAAADAQQHLGPALLEVHLQRHERQALFVGLLANLRISRRCISSLRGRRGS